MNRALFLFNVTFLAAVMTFGNLTATNQVPRTPQQATFHQAIINDSNKEIEQALEAIIKESRDEQSYLFGLTKAILNDATEEIKQNLQAVIHQGKDDKSPVLWAIFLKKPNALKALLECGAKVEPLFAQYAVRMGDIKIALLIVKSGANISDSMNDYMRLAAERSVTFPANREIAHELILELIKNGYDINNAWNLGPNSLGQAFPVSGNPDTFRFLIKNGANPNHTSKNSKGGTFTPLIEAICNIQSVKALIECGADINLKANPYPNHPKADIRGEHTPLYFAIQYGQTDVVEYLLNCGAALQ